MTIHWRIIATFLLIGVLLVVVAYELLGGQLSKEQTTRACIAWSQQPENYDTLQYLAEAATAQRTLPQQGWNISGTQGQDVLNWSQPSNLSAAPTTQ